MSECQYRKQIIWSRRVFESLRKVITLNNWNGSEKNRKENKVNFRWIYLSRSDFRYVYLADWTINLQNQYGETVWEGLWFCMVLTTLTPLQAWQRLEKLQAATAGPWRLLLTRCWCGRLRMWLPRTASAKWLQLQWDEVPLNPASPKLYAALIQMIHCLACHHRLLFLVICPFSFRHLTGETATYFQNCCDQSQPKGLRAAGHLQRVEVWKHHTKCTVNPAWKSSA